MERKPEYENEKIKLVASEPSSSVKKYAEEHMDTVTRSSKRILRAFTQNKK